MPTSHTRTTLCNVALDNAGLLPIASYDTDITPPAKWLRRNYEHIVETEIAAHLVTCCREPRTLARDPLFAGSDRWAYRFLWPTDALSILPPTEENNRKGYRPLDSEQSGDYLYTNADEVTANFLVRKLEPGVWSPPFADYIACLIAYKIAKRFGQKPDFLRSLSADIATARETLEQAELMARNNEPEIDITTVDYTRNNIGV